jgi:hypothetical protein
MNFWLKVSALTALGLVSAGGVYMFLTRESGPSITCFSIDGGIRPQNRCVMNPFRDRSAELKAEAVLTQLQSGNERVLGPFLSGFNEDNKNHILKNETKYRITSWRVGDMSASESEVSLLYWVTRENYEWEEEVRFDIKKARGEWNVTSYSAIY